MPTIRAGALTALILATAALVAGCGSSRGAAAQPPTTPTRIVTVTRSQTVRTQTVTAMLRRRSRPAHRAPTGTTTAAEPLAGRVIGVDPGHNGANGTDPTYIDHQIWNGREYENCNTTGTETDAGYTEARFNWNVATYLVADLKREGARVVLTRHSNDGVGPCVSRRAQIFNQAHVAVGVAIHADGGPADGRGFAILEPVADGINNAVVGPSDRFARDLRAAFLAGTGMPESTYDGIDALQPRDDLAGENLTRRPYALIECGNMRNSVDAALLISPRWQQRAAAAIAVGITRFVGHR